MIPLAVLALMPFAAKDIGLMWDFPGTVRPGAGKVDLFGKDLRGEVHWFVSPKRRVGVEALAKDDTQRTKEADPAKGFTHVQAPTRFAGLPAIVSDQRYLWAGVPVASRCVYCVEGNRGWVVRLWWPRGSATAPATATAFLKTFKRVK